MSDRTSLPEIVGNDGGVASIDDAVAWTSMLDAALRGDSESRASRVRAGAIARFSWDASAGEVKRVYEAICGKA